LTQLEKVSVPVSISKKGPGNRTDKSIVGDGGEDSKVTVKGEGGGDSKGVSQEEGEGEDGEGLRRGRSEVEIRE